jgi:tetracycline repressor-like protein
VTYRRWPTKDHLAVALAARILGEVPIADTADLRADLTGFAAEVLVDQVAGPVWHRVLVTGAPVDRDYAERLVAAALDGAFTAKE